MSYYVAYDSVTSKFPLTPPPDPTPDHSPWNARILYGQYVSGKLGLSAPPTPAFFLIDAINAKIGNTLDIEKGDATPADASSWFNLNPRRWLYSDLSDWPKVIAALSPADRASAYWWIASTSPNEPHFPTCVVDGITYTAHACQYRQNVQVAGGSYDISVVDGSRVQGLDLVVTAPPTTPPPVTQPILSTTPITEVPVSTPTPDGASTPAFPSNDGAAFCIGSAPDPKSTGGKGFWIFMSDGSVWAEDGARFLGSYGSLPADQREATPDFVTGCGVGNGYVLVHRDATPDGKSGYYRFGV